MCCVPSGGGGPTMPNCAAPQNLTGRCEVYDTYMRLLWEWTSPYADLYNEVQFTNDPTFSSTIYQGVRNHGVTSFPSQYHDYRGLPPTYPDGHFPVDTYYLRVRTSSGNWCVPTTWGNPYALRPENCTDFRTPNATPTVSITAPPSGSTYLQGDTVTISASANDSDGTITSISLYRGSTLFWGMSNPSSTANYSISFPWYNIPAGSYSITARATDNRGAVGVSAPVNFTVNAFQNISGNVYIDPNATVNLTTGICTGNAGALTGAEGSLGVRVTNTIGGGTYNSTVSSGNWSVATPPASDGRFRAALLGLDPNFVCACPTGCSYGAGIDSPQSSVNFYLTPTADAWWQVEGGPIAAFAGAGQRALSSLIPEFCSLPTCNPYLIVNQNGGDSEGYVLTGGSYVSGTDQIDESGHNWVAQMSSPPDKRQDYHYFKVLALLPTSPTSDFIPFDPIEGSVTSLDKPDKDQEFANGDQARAYFHAGEAVIDSPWSVESDEKLVVLVDGNITIEEPITVETGGFFMLVASGDITFDASLGTDDLNNLEAVAEGVFVADGILKVESAETGGDKRFIGEGTFVGWSGVKLERDYDDGAGRRALNNVSAVEYFRYRPDFITAAPEEFMRSRYSWQQVNP